MAVPITSLSMVASCRSNRDVEVVKVVQSGGVVMRPSTFRKSTRTLRCKEYFYGPRGDLSPHSQTVRMDELKIYRIGGGPKAPSSALPIGETICIALNARGSHSNLCSSCSRHGWYGALARTVWHEGAMMHVMTDCDVAVGKVELVADPPISNCLLPY